jgi:hypothetical protein
MLTMVCGTVALAGCTDEMNPPETTGKVNQQNDGNRTPAEKAPEGKSSPDRGMIESSMEAELAAFGKSLDDLDTRAEEVAEDVRAQLREDIQALRTRSDELKKSLSEWKSATNETWESTRTAIEKSWAEFRESLRETIDRWKDDGTEK